MSLVVVGVDGSEHGDLALDFAAEEAELRQAVLRVVCAWQMPPTMTVDMGLVGGVFDGLREDAEEIAKQAAERAKEARPSVEVETRVIEGHAGSVLVQESKGATLLVVSNRGRSGLAGILLGSVSNHVIHHAHCPVTVVRKP